MWILMRVQHTTSPLNEDGGEYVESQVSTEPEIQHKSSNRRVTKELLSEAGSPV